MPTRTSEHVREAIIADIRAGVLSCRAIARKHKVAASTVSALAREARISAPFERSQAKTREATAARRFDARAARTALIEQLYDDASRMRERAWAPYTQVVGTGPATMLVTTKLPPMREQREAFTALGIALDKAMALEARDDDGGSATGRTMINDLFGAFKLAYHQQSAPVEPDVDLSAATDTGTDPAPPDGS